MESLLPISSRSLQYYVIAKRWSSDLEFFRLESSFLHQLLDRCISRLQDEAHLQKLVEARKDLQEIKQLSVDDLLLRQITQLELMAEDVIPEDVDALAAVQVKLEYYMSELNRSFRTVKQKIFRLVLDSRHNDRLFPN
ncbi:hypothetical protein [Mucilaginibacter pocheonensis]|uniref:Uncharacterized protein n=1 Tax=Mucilaginibacter pocheonensis TaxID=398050 RepID=A0ABU1TC32_9SPHI|nr:hypothetical protein [Mucilaginibacter pocheonensis]MDR6942755.1 hypothetical protein [Mucilaginibacter pocheonensis]